MMVRPSIDELLRKVDSKYTLVVAAARRGRELMVGRDALVQSESGKPVTVALEELHAGKLLYNRGTEGPK